MLLLIFVSYIKYTYNNDIMLICIALNTKMYMLLFLGTAMVSVVKMDCPLQNWNIHDHAQYFCTVNNIFLRFRVVGLNESDKSMIFSSSDNSGLTLTSGKYSSTLLTKANGLTAVITFSATINNSQVICDDFVTTEICNITIKGNL